MAFDKQTFLVRTTSALVFGAIMLLALFGPQAVFIIVFGIVTYIGSKEFAHLIERIENKQFNPLITAIFSIACVAVYLQLSFLLPGTFQSQFELKNLLLIFVLPVLTVFLTRYQGKVSRLGLGFIYIPLSLGLLAQLYQIDDNYPWALIMLIWVNDTMQYIMGSLFGKHPMAPIVSPKKTWEGTIYGSLCSIAVAVILSFSTHFFSLSNWIAIALSATVVGTLGDLLESYIKRRAGVKDSGNIMPGHGGILDRFDSILLAAPVLYVLVKILSALA